ncbi:DUF3703 domain-containing protein [Sphingomonas sp. CJ99]
MRPIEHAELDRVIRTEVARYRAAARIGDVGAAWWALERAHILSQPNLRWHSRVHWAMFVYALRCLDPVEATGQLARLLLAPIGALTGRIPMGNNGRARVSAFAAMPIPDDLRALIERSSQ